MSRIKHFLAVNVICGIQKILDIIIHKSVEVNSRAFDPRRLFLLDEKTLTAHKRVVAKQRLTAAAAIFYRVRK